MVSQATHYRTARPHLKKFGDVVDVGDTVVAEIWGVPGDENTVAEIKGKVWDNREGFFLVGDTKILMVWNSGQSVSPLVKSARVVSKG